MSHESVTGQKMYDKIDDASKRSKKLCSPHGKYQREMSLNAVELKNNLKKINSIDKHIRDS